MSWPVLSRPYTLVQVWSLEVTEKYNKTLGLFDVGRGLVASHSLPNPKVKRRVHQLHVAARELLLCPGVRALFQGSEVGLGGILL
jgi:hypothetical protein